MHAMPEVETEVTSKIQAGARERGVSVDVYLRELIEQKGLSPRKTTSLIRESEFAYFESGRQVTGLTRPSF